MAPPREGRAQARRGTPQAASPGASRSAPRQPVRQALQASAAGPQRQTARTLAAESSRSSGPASRPQREPLPGQPGAAPPDLSAEPQALAEAAAELGLALDERQRAQLLAYCALLRKWNAVYNLTAVRDPGAMLVQHLFDCLAVLPPLRSGPDRLAAGAVVLDVGSGGGLPGVVLAVCAPGAQVHCVDTVGKKAAFITQVRAELQLPNLHAHHARVEDLRAGRELPAATLIVSRAFSSLAQFVSLTAHLLAPGGAWAAMKGQWPEDEIAALPAGVRLGATFTLQVPRLDAQRHLLMIEPAA